MQRSQFRIELRAAREYLREAEAGVVQDTVFQDRDKIVGFIGDNDVSSLRVKPNGTTDISERRYCTLS